jgi:fatty acid desaturase
MKRNQSSSMVAETARPPAPRSPEKFVSLYTELMGEVREQGLLKRRYAWYWTTILVAVASFAATWFGILALGNSWFQLILAALLGVVTTQFGFIGHDAAHRQIFRSAAWNEWTARILSGTFAGMSLGWWRTKHNKHHAAPNQEGKDPDIGPGAIAFTRAIVESRSGFPGWFARHQGWFYFPLLTLEGINLHRESVQTVLRPHSVPHQRVEATLILTRLIGYVTLLLMILPVGKAASFFGVQMAVFGLCLGGSFAPNHKGMPIVPATMKIDFLRRQVLMSRNVRGGLLVDFAMGGLNYQIEHHLFPSMPRPNLKRAQPIVRAYCLEHDVSYSEVGLFASYGIVVGYLNNVGLRARDPFECPLASQFRD